MLVKDIMTRQVVTVSPDTMIVDVAKIIFKHGFHGIPVVEGKKLVGIITESDFFVRESGILFLPSYIDFLKESKFIGNLPEEEKSKMDKLLSLTAKDIMTSDVISVNPDTQDKILVDIIKEHSFGTLPVIDKAGKLVGVVTMIDLIGVVKKGMIPSVQDKDREVEGLARDVRSWWGKSLVYVMKTHVRSWKAIFIIAFVAGFFAAIIWTISISIQST